MIEKVVSSMSSGMSRATCCATWESQMTRRGLDFRLFNTRLTSRSFATTATASERRSFPWEPCANASASCPRTGTGRSSAPARSRSRGMKRPLSWRRTAGKRSRSWKGHRCLALPLGETAPCPVQGFYGRARILSRLLFLTAEEEIGDSDRKEAGFLK